MKTMLATVALLVAVSANAAAGQEVDIAFRDGRVSLAAADASATYVLAVWSKVGQTEMKGTELLEKRLVTLRLADVPEGEALQLILGREFSFTGSLKRFVEPGTSGYAYLSVTAVAAEPWVDPEVKYAHVYYVPENAVPDSQVPKYQALEGEWFDPELRYQSAYYVPEKAQGESATPVYKTVDPGLWTDPETRFSYYDPSEGAEQPKPVYPKTSIPSPWVDPEVRFKDVYVVPNKAVK
jgi:hypothetical protein